jgi:hypothetical protein
MRTTTLNMQQAFTLAAVLAVLVLIAKLVVLPRRIQLLVPAVTEIALLAGLDGLWMKVGGPTVASPDGGFDRARWLEHLERRLYIPREQDLVQFLAAHKLLAQGANLYYASMHFTVMGILLFWLFWRHRDRYRDIRTCMVIFTGLALIVQLIPLAPPRLMPELGFVDVAKLYGQSVYGGIGNFQPAQFGAMPSVHVGWALLTAWAVIKVSPSRWRWLVLLHTTLMCLVVVATANHWWGDGIVAAFLLVLARGIQLAVRRAYRSWRDRAVQPATLPEASASPDESVRSADLRDASNAPT